MKKLITLLLVLLTLNGYSQTPIDYDNIDYLLLDTLIIGEVNKRRVVMGNPKINYSPTIRNGVSTNQTSILVRNQKVYHPNKNNLYEKIILDLKTECEKKYNSSISSITPNTEVSIMLPINKKIKTYQELSIYFVDLWESSEQHKYIILGYGWSSKLVIGAISVQSGVYSNYKVLYASFQIVSPVIN